MNKCLLCNKKLVLTRRKYCSKFCIKRSWYARNTKGYSLINKDPKFWESETGIGFTWEKYAAKRLNAEHMKFNGSNPDLIKDGIGIDVKACNLYRRKNRRGAPVKNLQSGVWVFNRNKPKKSVALFFCVCLENNRVIKEYMIPSDFFGKSGSVIGHKSKFDKFLFTG